MWPFLKKNKKLVIHVFNVQDVHVPFKLIKKSMVFVPEWWKKLPKAFIVEKTFYPVPTMKSCAGFIDLYKHGIIVPMWCDVNIVVGPTGTKDYAYKFSNEKSNAAPHVIQQREGFFSDTEFQHLKMQAPWSLYCEEEVEFLTLDATWNNINYKTMKVLPGIMSYTSPSYANINLVFSRTEQTQLITIPFNTPMMQLVPLTDRPIEIVHHVEDLKNKLTGEHFYRPKFLRSDLAIKNISKEDKVCPIHGEGMK